jgi:hypothetical protein
VLASERGRPIVSVGGQAGSTGIGQFGCLGGGVDRIIGGVSSRNISLPPTLQLCS